MLILYTLLLFKNDESYSPCGSTTNILALSNFLDAIELNKTVTALDLPLPVEPRIAQWRATNLFRSSFAIRLSEILIVPMFIEFASSYPPYIISRSFRVTRCTLSPVFGDCETPLSNFLPIRSPTRTKFTHCLLLKSSKELTIYLLIRFFGIASAPICVTIPYK